jgi:hypothetical protein
MESFSVSCLCDIISVAYCNYRNQHWSWRRHAAGSFRWVM